MRAEVLCVGCEGVAKDKYEYRGMMNCSSVTRLGKGAKECPFGCIGLGECKEVCPFDAIKIETEIAKIIPRKNARAAAYVFPPAPQLSSVLFRSKTML